MSLTNSFGSALGFCVALTAGSNTGLAQESARPVRVGLFVSGFASEYAGHDRGLIAGLRDHGYIEGKNLTVVRRYGNLDIQQISGFAQELAKSELDAIVTVCTVTTQAAMRATKRTPIVMLSVSDPVGHGLAASLARPGTNVTGRSSLSRTLVPKLVELFHDMVPGADRIAVGGRRPRRLLYRRQRPPRCRAPSRPSSGRTASTALRLPVHLRAGARHLSLRTTPRGEAPHRSRRCVRGARPNDRCRCPRGGDRRWRRRRS